MRQSDLARFNSLLEDLYSRSTVDMGDIERFEFLSNNMFNVLLPSGALGSNWREFLFGGLLESENSLDSGNPYWPAAPEFLNEIVRSVSDMDRVRGYYGPQAQERLCDAVRSFLKAEGEIPSANLDVTVGAGTVHLYDLLCRHLIRRDGDVVLSAHPIYGFFIPHAERAGGRTVLLEPDNGFRCTPDLLYTSIRSLERDKVAQWTKSAAAQVEVWLAALLSRLGHSASPDLLDAARAEVASVPQWPDRPREIDSVLQRLLSPLLARFGLDWETATAAGRLPTPPRVVTWLHINPTQGGDLYRQSEVDELAEVLTEAGIVPVEDLAYHSIRAPLSEVGSFLRSDIPAHQLLGLSKPLGIADCRVGLLVSTPGLGKPLSRLVETSVGWVPTFVQTALQHVLASPHIGQRLTWQSEHAPDSYAAKATLALATLKGVDKSESPDVRARAAAICRETAGTLIDRGEGSLSADVVRSSMERFLASGLSQWFSVPRQPESGFFVMVDCAPLLKSDVARRLGLSCAFDVFALLVHFFGVRTIPEEVMSVRGREEPATLLRLTFGIPEQTWVRALLLIHIGLEILANLTEPANEYSSH
ncbi:aminotransferase class I/II-fold pyridoxal phosphate-dependent enzyme [Streptomyces sp. NPDC006552]|uniref:aminotransferase class I/II-fold pyridoxal phosphate-dependent enzyme n=1 Tax=Streptomyces sp. NPDC006552 TaxID=3157179 RepID=UPI00339F6E82